MIEVKLPYEFAYANFLMQMGFQKVTSDLEYDRDEVVHLTAPDNSFKIIFTDNYWSKKRDELVSV